MLKVALANHILNQNNFLSYKIKLVCVPYPATSKGEKNFNLKKPSVYAEKFIMNL